MKRTPITSTPFEQVEDDNGRVYAQCTMCGDYEYAFDALKALELKAKPLGVLRATLLRPWLLIGYLKFFTRHVHCIDSHRRH